MKLGRLTMIGLCVAAALAMTATAAQAAPRWFVKETGLPPKETGLHEVLVPETLLGEGELSVYSNAHPPKERPISNCLVRNRESIDDPEETELPGTGEMEEFEVVCEKGTGSLNAAMPYPCTHGETFELKATGLNWVSTLETSGSGPLGPRIYDDFPDVAIEVDCLVNGEHAVYTGSLRPQVTIGRLKFTSSSGQVEEPVSGEHFYFKGSDFIEPRLYKDVRADD